MYEFFCSIFSPLTMHGQHVRLVLISGRLLKSAVVCRMYRQELLTRNWYMDLSLDIASRGVNTLGKVLAKFLRRR